MRFSERRIDRLVTSSMSFLFNLRHDIDCHISIKSSQISNPILRALFDRETGPLSSDCASLTSSCKELIFCVRLTVIDYFLSGLSIIFPLCCNFCLSFESTNKCQPSFLGGDHIHAVEKLNLGIVKCLMCRLRRFNASIQTAK